MWWAAASWCLYLTAVKPEVLSRLWGAIIHNVNCIRPRWNKCVYVRKERSSVNCGSFIQKTLLFMTMENIWEYKIQISSSKSWLISLVLVLLFSVLGHFSLLPTSWSGSHLLHNLMVLLACCCRWAASLSFRCTPKIQPWRTLFTWRGGSWVDLQGWKRSQNVSYGLSSADAAQSHSCRRCTWHKIRWLYLEPGVLRQKEEWGMKCCN